MEPDGNYMISGQKGHSVVLIHMSHDWTRLRPCLCAQCWVSAESDLGSAACPVCGGTLPFMESSQRKRSVPCFSREICLETSEIISSMSDPTPSRAGSVLFNNIMSTETCCSILHLLMIFRV